MKNLRHFKPKKIQLVKILPLVVWVSIILVKLTLGIADPDPIPPPPTNG
ncbi:MAG: hypothetical protein ACW964_10165 [Candidatus Hodarchaeales archaeon]|jgi:hypothetical protein